ncbi:prepilin peptidase [Paenibacillus sp. 1P07SE]|uniref:prepilin peptidase n=1 Tax=Paenibacillus sp. 1P07SE TaxID=3132209 RepID=UPI0039A645A5
MMDAEPTFLVKGFLFALFLMIASSHDIRTREIPNWLPLALVGSGLLQLQLVSALLGLLATSLPYLLAAVITGGKIGGGDIKLMAACGFVLGPVGGILQSIVGLTLVLLFAIGIAFRSGLKSAKQTALPLVPFLAAGGLLSFTLLHLL